MLNFKDQTFGIELEFTGITRKKGSRRNRADDQRRLRIQTCKQLR